MKKLGTILISLSLILNMSYTVFAAENTSIFSPLTNSGNVESILIDPNGNVIVNTIDELLIPSDKPVIKTESPTLTSPFQRNQILCSSSLNNYNNYSYLWAYSQSNYDISYMFVSCTGFYESGGEVGRSLNESPSGWTVAALSAIVQTPSSPFPLKIASGNSFHLYRNTGMNDVRHSLNYQK